MSITYEYVGKTGGGSTWSTMPVPAVQCKGEYNQTKIFTVPPPPTGKVRIVRCRCTFSPQSGYPAGAGATATVMTQNTGIDQSVTSTSGGNTLSYVGATTVSTDLSVMTNSGTGHIIVSGTLMYIDMDKQIPQ